MCVWVYTHETSGDVRAHWVCRTRDLTVAVPPVGVTYPYTSHPGPVCVGPGRRTRPG